RASVYGASKVAVNYFIRSLRSDLANSGIRPSLVHPGFIKTAMTDTNDFAMPFLLGADKAAAIIIRQLERGKLEIRFPLQLSILTRLAGALPEALRLLISKHFQKQAHS
ncbi:MAG: SDR family NAD(P)-dependent oxidoreductase, partial [Pseudomonadales bacterium]|nr:SDR family NAD(P)-dependent oxidoreductase [Pseudomonadales bacterium]